MIQCGKSARKKERGDRRKKKRKGQLRKKRKVREIVQEKRLLELVELLIPRFPPSLLNSNNLKRLHKKERKK
jgi:hypothetical protein